MLLAIAWTEKQQYVRFITKLWWIEFATWKTALSGNKNYGLNKRRGGYTYVGKALSCAVVFDKKEEE